MLAPHYANFLHPLVTVTYFQILSHQHQGLNTLTSSSLTEKDQGSCRSKTTRENSFINKQY